MNRQINKYRPIITSIFLAGYLSFILLSIVHFHSNTVYNNYKSSEIVNYVLHSTTSDNDENCPICLSFSSINVNTINLTFSSSLLIENCPLIIIASGYKSNSQNVKYLRGPPNNNILSL